MSRLGKKNCSKLSRHFRLLLKNSISTHGFLVSDNVDLDSMAAISSGEKKKTRMTDSQRSKVEVLQQILSAEPSLLLAVQSVGHSLQLTHRALRTSLLSVHLLKIRRRLYSLHTVRLLENVPPLQLSGILARPPLYQIPSELVLPSAPIPERRPSKQC